MKVTKGVRVGMKDDGAGVDANTVGAAVAVGSGVAVKVAPGIGVGVTSILNITRATGCTVIVEVGLGGMDVLDGAGVLV